VQTVPDIIMPASHGAFQTHFTERLLYWNLRRFRTGRRKGQMPYELLGLKLPDLSFWEFLKLTPEELREKLSGQADAS
jgi:hypothetical protein